MKSNNNNLALSFDNQLIFIVNKVSAITLISPSIPLWLAVGGTPTSPPDRGKGLYRLTRKYIENKGRTLRPEGSAWFSPLSFSLPPSPLRFLPPSLFSFSSSSSITPYLLLYLVTCIPAPHTFLSSLLSSSFSFLFPRPPLLFAIKYILSYSSVFLPSYFCKSLLFKFFSPSSLFFSFS